MWFLLLQVALAGGPVLEPAGLSITEQPAQTYKFAFDDPPGRCLVRVELGADGVPTSAEARGCLARYGTAAEQAVKTWRWSAPGEPAATHVPVSFTPKGTAEVAAEAKCTYTLRVAPTGAVSADPKPPQSQCQLWPARNVSLGGAAGKCAGTVPATIGRTADAWATFDEACSEAARATATEVMRGSLFTFGTEQTRFLITFPDEGSGPPTAANVDIPDGPDGQPEDTRISTGDETEEEAEGIEVENHEVPEVTFPIFPSAEDLEEASDENDE